MKAIIEKLRVALSEAHLAIRQLREQGAPCRLWSDIEKANRSALKAAEQALRNPPPKPPVENVMFHIGGAKGYDHDEVSGVSTPNWSYLDSFDSFALAQANFQKYCRDYPITEFYVEIMYVGGRRERIDVDGNIVRVLVKGLWVEEE